MNNSGGCAAEGGKETSGWVVDEAACTFNDDRLDRRFVTLLEQLTEGVGKTIPFSCQDWANTKAAYRFLSNPKVDEAQILSGHFDCTRERFLKTTGLVLVLHDTTTFSYQRDDVDAIGITHQVDAGPRKADGRRGKHTVCGILMHSSLVVTLEGLPLGIAATKFWTRKQFKGTNALRGKINATRVPIESKESQRWLDNLTQSSALLQVPQRCVHVGDRESDIYELFCAAQKAGSHFLVRTCVDRLAEDGTQTIADLIESSPCRAVHRIERRNHHGKVESATLELRFRRIHIKPPLAKQKRYPELDVTVIHATERGSPKGRPRIEWKLMTDLPVRSRAEAVEKLDWYAMRWKVETFHKILKSGCKAEDSKLRTAQRLTNLIAMFCLLSWRIFWLTMINRSAPNSTPGIAFTDTELQILDAVTQTTTIRGRKRRTLGDYLICLARLGGYLNRANDGPPGNTVIWRGMSRLADITLGVRLADSLVGN